MVVLRLYERSPTFTNLELKYPGAFEYHSNTRPIHAKGTVFIRWNRDLDGCRGIDHVLRHLEEPFR